MCLFFVVASLVLFANCSIAQSVTSAREFSTGKKLSFDTTGHPKAKGAKFRVSYPKSWASLEGERPNIVQKFVSEAGRGLDLVLIVTKELPGIKPSRQELQEFFTPKELGQLVPPGSTLIDARATSIEGLPAGLTEYQTTMDRAGLTLAMHVVALSFVTDGVFVQMQCQTGGQSIIETSSRFATLLPLCKMIFNSIVIPGLYK